MVILLALLSAAVLAQVVQLSVAATQVRLPVAGVPGHLLPVPGVLMVAAARVQVLVGLRAQHLLAEM